jgi:hypothetical protein
MVPRTPESPAVDPTHDLLRSAEVGNVTMQCPVPTPLYQRWRGACNQFLSTLTLTR